MLSPNRTYISMLANRSHAVRLGTTHLAAMVWFQANVFQSVYQLLQLIYPNLKTHSLLFLPKKCIKKRRRSNVVGKFREVSDSVWVSFEAVIIEKTLKEEWTDQKNFDDNYNYYSDTMIITTTFAPAFPLFDLLTFLFTTKY